MFSISAGTITSFPLLKSAGLYHRRQTAGGETSLVNSFLADRLSPAPRGQIRVVFVEPRIETGFPDIVAAYLDARAVADWDVNRASLAKRDICLLHLLATGGSRTIDEIKPYFASGLKGGLQKLSQLNLISQTTRKRWRIRSYKQIFALRRLVAVEAKVDAKMSGVDQAAMNRWFASESYLLLPRAPKSGAVHAELERIGIGLLTADTMLDEPVLPSLRGSLPTSYATWLFNEWACRAIASTALPSDDAEPHLGLVQVDR